MHAPVFLLTDFGAGRHYAGILHAVLLSIDPTLNVVHLDHEVNPGSVREGGYLLEAAWPHLPQECVVVAVVDPGVGTARKVLGLRVRNPMTQTSRMVIAPDNGLLTGLLTNSKHQQDISLRHCDRPDLCSPTPSATFHGRDVFVPLGGALACGKAAFDDLGPIPSSAPISIDSWRGEYSHRQALGEIVHIDRFGNLISNLQWIDLAERGYVSAVEVRAAPRVALRVGDHSVTCFAKTFGKAAPHEIFAYRGSGGALEIACRDGRANEALNAGLGAVVSMSGGEEA